MPEAVPLIVAASLATTAVGTGVQLYGASQQRSAQQRIIQAELAQERLRRQAMELDIRRRQRQAIRNAQQARALALSAATNQGAAFGTGLFGGYGQISGVENRNLQGISQAQQLGEANFGLTSQISSGRMGVADATATMAFGSGLTSLGGSLMNSAGALGRLSQIPMGSRTASANVDYYGNSGNPYA
jgi:hypothetical protein